MQTLEGVKYIKEIEEKYDVMSIKYKGISVWPYLRLYIKDTITHNKENKASASVIGLVLRCLFAYNPFRAFKKHNIWVFTACDRRKRLGDKMVHRISGAFAAESMNSLMIEKPLKVLGHYGLNEIEEKDIISESWLLMTFHAIEVLSRCFKPKLDNEDLMRRILVENNLKFNYLRYVRMLNAQRCAVKMMMFLVSKPKAAFVECPYDTMGYVWAFHEAGVKVVEMQHGSLNRNHAAYNANEYERKTNPDCICVFGESEYNYLTKEEPQFAQEVRKTGLYMLERANQFFSNDIFKRDREKYESVVLVSGQTVYDNVLSAFVDAIAQEHKELLFVYVPRQNLVDLHFKSENVRLNNGVNIYEYLKWADLHITISSTTSMEALYFRTPTIFYNYKNISATYFKDIISEGNGVAFADTPQQFDEALKKVRNRHIEYSEVFARDHLKKIKSVINEII